MKEEISSTIDKSSYLKFPSYSRYKKLFYSKWDKVKRRRKRNPKIITTEKQKFYTTNILSLPSFSTDDDDGGGGPLFASYYSLPSSKRCFKSEAEAVEVAIAAAAATSSSAGTMITNNNKDASFINTCIFYENVNIVGIENENEFDTYYRFTNDKMKNMGHYFKNFNFACPICLDDDANILNALIYSCGHAICKNCVINKLTIFKEISKHKIFVKCDLCRHVEEEE